MFRNLKTVNSRLNLATEFFFLRFVIFFCVLQNTPEKSKAEKILFLSLYQFVPQEQCIAELILIWNQPKRQKIHYNAYVQRFEEQ